jgi:hypothetical protein
VWSGLRDPAIEVGMWTGTIVSTVGVGDTEVDLDPRAAVADPGQGVDLGPDPPDEGDDPGPGARAETGVDPVPSLGPSLNRSRGPGHEARANRSPALGLLIRRGAEVQLRQTRKNPPLPPRRKHIVTTKRGK